MTSRERLLGIYRKEEVDRAAIRIWGAVPGLELYDESYREAYEAAIERTDLVQSWSSGPAFYMSGTDKAWVERKALPSTHECFEPMLTVLHTPKGEICSTYEKGGPGRPGYTSKYMIETPEDAERFLSVPYEPYEINAESFSQKDNAMGDRGITVISIPEAMYRINALMGSETFALWSVMRRSLLHELIGEMDRRIRDMVQRHLEAGLGPVYGYVGPELCIPPLQSPKDFQEFVVQYEKPLIQMIHDAGCYVWLHCHGGMGPAIEGFLEMEVDVLNPVEPPPMGDVTMAEVRSRVGDRMGLEGNIEKGDIYRASEKRIMALVEQAFEEAAGGPFVLCQSAGFMEWPTCDEQTSKNLLAMINHGIQHAREMGGGPYCGCNAGKSKQSRTASQL